MTGSSGSTDRFGSIFPVQGLLTGTDCLESGGKTQVDAGVCVEPSEYGLSTGERILADVCGRKNEARPLRVLMPLLLVDLRHHSSESEVA